MSEILSESQEQEKEQINSSASSEIEIDPTIDLSNPTIYLNEFENSINFSEIVEDRLNKVRLEHPLEELSKTDIAEITDTLRSNKDYKDKLWNWQTAHNLPLNPANLPLELKEAIYEYWATIEKCRSLAEEGGMSKTEIINLDIKRSADHAVAAKKMTDFGLAPNLTVGRLLVQFMSIDAGYDRVDQGRDERRLNFFR